MLPNTITNVNHQKLQEFCTNILHKGGFTLDEANLTAKSLVLADLCGYHSHGVIRVLEYLNFLETNIIFTNKELEIISETENHCVADGNFSLGQVQIPRLLNILIKKAQNQAVVSATIKNCGHIGRLGEWVEHLAQHGFAAMMLSNDNGVLRCVAPPNGKDARVSTNPIAFSIPLKNSETFTIDISTSSVAIGKMRVAYLADKEVETGILQDANGNATTDPSILFNDPRGTILPMGGYKGFALSMIVDCLAAGLSGGFMPPAPDGTAICNSAMVTIWNPKFFAGLDYMQQEAEKYIAYVKSSNPINTNNPVRIAGDRTKQVKQNSLKNGINIETKIIEKLVEKSQKLQINIPTEFIQ